MYFKPSYLPQNDAASRLVKTLAEELGLSLNKKNKIILASFIAVAKNANGTKFNWWTGNDNKKLKFWSLYEHVSNASCKKVYQLLMQHGYLLYQIGSTNEQVIGMGFGKPTAVFAQRLPEDLLKEAVFIEANLPPVLVNRFETYEDKLERKKKYPVAPKLGRTEVRKLGRDYALAYRPVMEMNQFYSKHPLYNPIRNEFYSSARRVFHNESFKAGGRWYGGWTFFKSHQRHSFTIDQQPIVHVDINACFLSLISGLVGIPMNIGDTWRDAYAPVVEQIPEIAEARTKVKQVIMELSGSGNAYKRDPGKDEMDKNEFNIIRNLCLEAYPALETMEPNKTKLQTTKGTWNFTNEISFHESSILTNTLLKLKSLGVVAYGVHDCLIVKLGDEVLAADTFRSEFKSYVSSFQKQNKKPKLNLDVALSLEFNASKKVRIRGGIN